MMNRSIGPSLVVLVMTSLACSSSTTPTPATDAGVDSATTAKGAIGDPCPKGTGDCLAGLECAAEDPGGGQCVKVCAPSKDADCGDTTKYACSSGGHCYVRCAATTDCKRASQGYVCKDDTPARPPVKFCDIP